MMDLMEGHILSSLEVANAANQINPTMLILLTKDEIQI